jgi:hypothetical protein
VEHFCDSSPCINCCLTGYEHTLAGKVHFFDDMDAICSLQPDDASMHALATHLWSVAVKYDAFSVETCDCGCLEEDSD